MSCNTTAKTRIVEQNLRAVSQSPPSRWRIRSRSRLRGGNPDASRQIRRRHAPRHARKQRAQLAEPLQLFTAFNAFVEMLAQINPLLRLRSTRNGAVHISGKFGAHRGTVHGSSSREKFLRKKL